MRTEEASEALRNYPTPADAQRAVSRLESALRPTQPLAREIFPGVLPLTPPGDGRVVEEDRLARPTGGRPAPQPRCGAGSRPSSAWPRGGGGAGCCGYRRWSRLRAALSVWTRETLRSWGVSFNLNVRDLEYPSRVDADCHTMQPPKLATVQNPLRKEQQAA